MSNQNASLQDQTQSVLNLLAEHVPLTLLADLAVPETSSGEILRTEGLPSVRWWEPGTSARASTPNPCEPDTA